MARRCAPSAWSAASPSAGADQPGLEDSHVKVLERSGGLRRRLARLPHAVPVRRSRRRRLPGDRAASFLRRDHRRLDPVGACPAAGRAAGRQLARLQSPAARAGAGSRRRLANFPDTAEPMPLPAPKSEPRHQVAGGRSARLAAVAHEYRRLQRQDAAPGGRSVGVRRCARRGWSERTPGTKNSIWQRNLLVVYGPWEDSRYGELR